MRRVVLSLLASCSFSSSVATTDKDASVDAEIDSNIDAPDAPPDTPRCTLWDPKLVMPCALPEPTPGLTLTAAASPYTYDTTNMGGVLRDAANTVVHTSTVTRTQSDTTVAAVMNLESFVMQAGSEMRVIGTKPLMILSWNSMTLDGIVGAGSYTAELNATTHVDGPVRTGAGANAGCATGVGQNGGNAAVSGGSGGGGGAGQRGTGGDGRIGDVPDNNSPGGPGGGLRPIPPLLRAGCKGGNSGTAGGGALSPATAASLARGGDGGGGVYFAARVAITVGGVLDAGGAGGGGAPQGTACGGGGGGSGGYLGFDAPNVTITGIVSANGGGGGGSAPFAGEGNQGANATMNAVAAPGGAANGCGLAGAAGGAGGAFDGADTTGMDVCGGGGGGGATGFILVRATTLSVTGATLSPGTQSFP